MPPESRQITEWIARSADDVYEYASNPAHLPEWAPGLGTSVERVEGGWFVDTASGRVGLAFAERNPFGVLDHDVTLPSGEVIHNPMRVVPLDDGCEVVFSLRRLPEMSDEDFERDAGLVQADLTRLKRLLEASRRSILDKHPGMDRDSLLAFVRYHAWANDRILTTAADLSDEELRRSGVLDHDSAFQTLRHLMDVDWSWREFCAGNDVGETYVWDHGFALDDLRAIHAFCLEEDARLRSLVESLDDGALATPWGTDPEFTRPRWLVVAHVVNHGTQHRSELARYVTECGHSPGDLDLLDALELPWPTAAQDA